MNVIPVLDIKQGEVVLAIRGQRANYRPVSTPLCTTSNPQSVIESFMQLYSFTTFYIADLDAIENKSDNAHSIAQLLQHFSHLQFLIDSGSNHTLWLNETFHLKNACPVLGTESYSSLDTLVHDIQWLEARDPIISFDYRNGKLIGCTQIMRHPELWTRRIIALNIDAVGTGSGCENPVWKNLLDRRPDIELLIGGGVRGWEDLQALRDQAAIHGVLVASCLHSKCLTGEQLNFLVAD